MKNPNETTVWEMETTRPHVPTPSWSFAAKFAAMGFFVGGGCVFFMGFSQVFLRPPLPPGQVYCGTAALASWFMMVVGAPIVAILFSILGAGIGGILDRNLRLSSYDSEPETGV
jgi:hypothetical protein